VKSAALTLLAISLLTLTACGGHSGRSSSRASQVCRQIHENTKLYVAFIQHRPLGSIPNPTLATIVTRQLGRPDEQFKTRSAGVVWWRYANTAYLVSEAAQSTPAHDLVIAKACNWALTRKRLGG
jgi:hypothetical protein